MALRLLHLVDSTCGGEGALVGCAAACTIPGVTHEVWCLGPPRLAHHATALGLPVTARITTTGPPESALRSLWRANQSRAAVNPAPSDFDAIVGWSPASVHVATRMLALDHTVPIVGVMAQGPDSAGTGWLAERRLRRALHRATILPLGTSLAGAWAGTLALGVTPIAPPVHTPARDPAPPTPTPTPPGMREALRAELGVQPGELAVLMLSDPATRGDVRRFAQVLGMARLTRVPLVGLAPRHAPGWERANRFGNATRRAWDIIAFDGPLASALPAADLAVWIDADAPGEWSNSPARSIGGGPLLGIAAAAAGIPVIAPDLPVTREALSAAGDVCLVNHPPGAVGETRLAGRLLDLALDEHARRAAGIALESYWLDPARRWQFHADLLTALRLATTVSRTSGDWWKALAGLHVA